MKETFENDNTTYAAAINIGGAIKSLQKDPAKLFIWFTENLMKANSDATFLEVLRTKELHDWEN